MKKNHATKLTLILGSTIATGLTMSAAQAEISDRANPFALNELTQGYMLTAQTDGETKSMKDGSCGEGKCGGAMMKGDEEKSVEGKCAGNKPMPTEGKCGEGKCGEGKCGANKTKAPE